MKVLTTKINIFELRTVPLRKGRLLSVLEYNIQHKIIINSIKKTFSEYPNLNALQKKLYESLFLNGMKPHCVSVKTA